MDQSIHTKTSIAVLPFVNRSTNGENEFFCDGITEEIINALANIPQLKVTSRTSSFYFKNKTTPIPEIAEQLQVSSILEGSVRLGGNMLRISAQLVDASSDSQVWSSTWDRKLENIFEIQDEISLLIADKLREQFGHFEINHRLAAFTTNNIGAYEHFLQGKHLLNKWNPEDVNKAISHFERATEIDPNLLDGHMGLADAYGFLATAGFAPREASWKKALVYMEYVKERNPDHPVLNYLQANYVFFTEANFSKAFHYTQKCIQAKPNYPEGQQFMSFLYMLSNNLDKGKEHLQYLMAIDPLNHESLFYQAYYLYRINKYDQSYAISKKLLADNPKNLPARMVSWYTLVQLGNYEQVLEEVDAIPEEMVMPDDRTGIKAIACLLSDQAEQAAPYMDEIFKRSSENASHQADAYAYWMYAWLGKANEAFAVVDKLFSHRSSIILLHYYGKLAMGLRKDPRFAEYAERIFKVSEPSTKTERTSGYEPEPVVAEKMKDALLDYLEKEQPYLNPSVSLRSLAQNLEMGPNQLSWLLNEKLGKNFNEFINDYRIAHFKELAVDPSNGHISLIGLAFESGFNSKTVFNTYFKKVEGMTPSAFVKQNS